MLQPFTAANDNPPWAADENPSSGFVFHMAQPAQPRQLLLPEHSFLCHDTTRLAPPSSIQNPRCNQRCNITQSTQMSIKQTGVIKCKKHATKLFSRVCQDKNHVQGGWCPDTKWIKVRHPGEGSSCCHNSCLEQWGLVSIRPGGISYTGKLLESQTDLSFSL